MKYNNAISKIKIDETFKENLIASLEENKKCSKSKKGGFIMKIKKVVITTLSLLGIILESGAVYAAFGGTINGVPVLEWMGIKFSNETYEEYVEPVENQSIENDDFKITLESTVCDDGFTILQFRVNISEEKLNSYKTEEDLESGWEVPFCYLSFNDPIINDNGYSYTNLNGANYNLIVDNEDLWVRGYSAQKIEEISENEYIIYQMWFLDETTLNGKENFTITLDDVVIGLGEDAIAVDGNFEIEVSKEKAISNTTTYTPENNNSLTYGKMTKTLEKVTISPLQNILTIKTVYEDVDIDDLTYVLDDDYIGAINYIAYDQNNANISAFSAELQVQITYEDGTIETGIPGEFEWSRSDFEHATYEVVEKIAIEKNSSITGINLKAYEVEDDPDNTSILSYIKAIGEYTINLNSGNTKSIERNEYIFDGVEHDPTDEFTVYAKIYYGMEYDELYEYFVEERESIDENVSLYIIEDDVNYIEISIAQEEVDEIKYTDYIEIKDKTMISDLVNLLNDNNLYSDFENNFEKEDIFDESPILHVIMNDWDFYLTAYDNFEDTDGTYINIFKVDVGDTTEFYKCNSTSFASDIENYYHISK